MRTYAVGTIRGPFTCGIGHAGPKGQASGADQGVQYCVKTPSGWVYFIKHKEQEATALKEAEAYRDEMLSKLPPIAYLPEETIIRLLTR